MIFKNKENLKYLFYTEKAPHSHTHMLFLNERKKKQTPCFVDKIHAISIQFAASWLVPSLVGAHWVWVVTGVGLFDWNLFKIPDHVRLIMANKQQRTQRHTNRQHNTNLAITTNNIMKLARSGRRC